MAKILLVEDDADLGERIAQWLKHEHHTVELVGDGEAGSDYLAQLKYDLIILDWGLPKRSGVDVLRQFRDDGGTTPVLMLTGRGKTAEKEEGLDAGADDYLTKPFEIREMAARVRALLRRVPQFTTNSIKIGAVELNVGAHKISVGGNEVQFAPREFAMLEFLMKHVDQVVTTDALLERVWSSESSASSETIYTCVRAVRKKLKEAGAGDLIRTVHGVGYKVEGDGKSSSPKGE
ncbi:MAG: response regulator transcription factor [Candidatus Melainabacteria bacterium]|jgi:DNA-binding response OmpR family regulator|nr:response regulator transcription factor [Candidatus Melainabacteria bacterium]